MRNVTQTRVGPKDGNCFAACLATVFNVGIDEVPDLPMLGWVEMLESWLHPRGFGFSSVSPSLMLPKGLAIASVGRDFPERRHCVVLRDGTIYWDPSPNPPEPIVYKVKYVIYFHALDPAQMLHDSKVIG